MRSVEGLCGAAIVTRGGRVALEAAGGLADAAAGVECTPRTRFQIASIRKQFAAVAALLLTESGRLDLAEPVTRWFPGAPPQWQRVTLDHLLTHTAGIQHWGNTPGFDPSQPMDLAERVALMLQASLLTEPGTHWRYSSPGYVLAAQIVARASGQPYPSFLAEHVLAPLGNDHGCAGRAAGPGAVGRPIRSAESTGWVEPVVRSRATG